MKHEIEHKGVVSSVTSSKIEVTLVQVSACAGCHAKSACSASDQKQKIIEITPDHNSYKVGDQVMVVGRSSFGLLAIVLAFIMPLFIMVMTLVVTLQLEVSEFWAALCSFIILLPYYIVLYLLQHKLRSIFLFTIRLI